MNESLLLAMVLLLLVVSVAALVVGLLARAVAGSTTPKVASGRAQRSARRRAPARPTDAEGLRGEVQALRVEVADALRHLAVVRYDAFGDMGGHLSWSMALLDDGGNGVVLTSIHGRSEARTYAKNINAWSCDQALSPEEEEAVKLTKAG
jgi:hypothetical protein